MLRFAMTALISGACGCCDSMHCTTSLAQSDLVEDEGLGTMIQLPTPKKKTGSALTQLKDQSGEAPEKWAGRVKGLIILMCLAAAVLAFCLLPTGNCARASAPPETCVAQSNETEFGRSPLEAFVDVVNSLMTGTVLVIPLAMSHAGWWGLFSIAYTTIPIAFCAQLLVECIRHYDTKENTAHVAEYGVIARDCFGRFGEAWVDTLFGVEMFFFVAWASANLATVLQDCFGLQMKWAMFAVWLSAVTVNGAAERFVNMIACSGFLALVVWFGTMWITGLNLPQRVAPEDHAVVGDLRSIMVLAGINIYSFGNISLIPHLYRQGSKRTKHMYVSIVWAGIIVVGALNALFGALVFHYFGTRVKEVAILVAGRSLDGLPLPHLGWLKEVAAASLFVKLIPIIPMGSEAIAAMLLRNFWPGEESPRNGTLHLVIVLSVLTGLFAEGAISVFAAVLGHVLSFVVIAIIPLLFYVKLEGPDASAEMWTLITLAMVFGAFVCAGGAALAFQEAFHRQSTP